MSLMDRKIDAVAELLRGLDTDRYPEPLDFVQALRMIRETADSALFDAVAAARDAGESWERVARYLGTTRQAAHLRYAGRAQPTRAS